MSFRKTSCKRIAIHPRDIEMLTGRGQRAAQKMLNRIKNELGRKKHQMVTISEFCQYIGFNEELVRNTIF